MKLIYCFLLALLLTACSNTTTGDAQRGMYYWRTTLQLSGQEREFLRAHNVDRLYVRYFDVVSEHGSEPVPNATIEFNDSLPRGVEVVPVVFITNDCMMSPQADMAAKLLQRVMQMSETNDVEGVREIQIDCDWTMKTRANFFAFAKSLRELCHKHDIKLSATIRLHQLSQPVPPVDRGVLMVYNTGDFTRLEVDKPILDVRDVVPYLKHLPGYDLPLASAWPLFEWRILFRADRYISILHDDDHLKVWTGDSIAVRCPTLQDIVEAQQAVVKKRRNTADEVILYDLSKTNINRFNYQGYEQIFNSTASE